MSQNEKILNHLQTHEGITSIEAIRLYGCTRLAARISDLRSRGHDIRSEKVVKKDGKKTVSYSRYWLQ